MGAMNAWSVPYHTLVLARFLVVMLLAGSAAAHREGHFAHLIGRKNRVLRWHNPWPKRAGE